MTDDACVDVCVGGWMDQRISGGMARELGDYVEVDKREGKEGAAPGGHDLIEDNQGKGFLDSAQRPEMSILECQCRNIALDKTQKSTYTRRHAQKETPVKVTSELGS
jgi:hypothetical protein